MKRWPDLTQPWFEHARFHPQCAALRAAVPEAKIALASRRLPVFTIDEFLQISNPTLVEYEGFRWYMESKGLSLLESVRLDESFRNF